MREQINSLHGVKAIALLFLFWWHGPIPRPPCDLGARTCEVLFIVSGFLVGYRYFGSLTPVTWKESLRYVSVKLVKFWPLHLVTLLVVMFKMRSTIISWKEWMTALLDIFLLQAWSPSTKSVFMFNGASWFLSALIFCYFMSPLFLRLANSVKMSIVLFPLVFIVRYIIEYAGVFFPNYFFGFNIHISPFIRCLEFFLGMLMVPLFLFLKAKVQYSTTLLFSIYEILIMLAIIISSVSRNRLWLRADFVFIFCLFVFIFSFNEGIVSRLFSARIFVMFSKIQFEFYILHQAVIQCMRNDYGKLFMDWKMQSIALFVTIIVVSLVYKKYISHTFSKWVAAAFNRIFCFFGIGLSV